MSENIVRLSQISISNFKNVANGSIVFENLRNGYSSSILGLYGQNGSGKTALIDVISLLKHALCGQAVPEHFCGYISVDADFSSLKYEFKIKDENSGVFCCAKYEFKIKKEIVDSNQDNDFKTTSIKHERLVIFDEVLSASFEHDEKKQKLQPIVDSCNTRHVFLPKTKYNALVGKNPEIEIDLLVAKKLARATSRSFVFSKELLDVIKNHCKDELYVFLFKSLINYGNNELFVISTANSGLISLNTLPLSFNYKNNSMGVVGNLMLPLNGVFEIPEEVIEIVKKIIDNMNIVLSKLIPTLKIKVAELGTKVMQNGLMGCRIQLLSQKNGKEIPLQYESEGIKKIISILQLLIVVYNKSSITVAIDELDSGIFEYLLGELLRIISEKGKGQLIFTSHNLRPLETIDRGFIAFSTVNTNNRYIRFNNVKSNNNLRDFYYRDIVLGEQNEPVYETTNNYEIAIAFRQAGDFSVS